MASDPDVVCESRALELGDVAWVLRVSSANGDQQDTDYVLDCIMERKTMFDLEASIQDKRYQEQKFRLVRCGIRGLIYLVEGPMPQGKGEALMTELVDTRLEGLVVHRTERVDDTIEYIHRSHVSFDRRLRAGQLSGLVLAQTLPQFSQRVTKNRNASLSDVFAKTLLQIRGCTPDRAAAIVAAYPTFAALLTQLQYDTAAALQEHIANLRTDRARRVGPAVAQHLMLSLRNEDPTRNLLPTADDVEDSQL